MIDVEAKVLLRGVAFEIASARDPRLVAACLTLALHGGEPGAQTKLAAQHGVGRATVSKWTRRFVCTLGLVPSPGMKRPAAVEAYRRRQLRVWAERKSA